MNRTLQGETLRIPLSDFLKQNDHGLLEMCDEMPHWVLFLNCIAYFLETERFKLRGSCIAQAVIKLMCEDHTIFEDGVDIEATDIRQALNPYAEVHSITESSILQNPSLTDAERSFLEFFYKGVNKKNIDLYVEVGSIEEVEFLAQRFAKSFKSPLRASISEVRFLHNGVGIIKFEIKGGYHDQDMYLVLKPPIKKDLRKNMSNRQLASKGELVRSGNDWFIEVAREQVEELLAHERMDFVEQDLVLSELMFQIGRTLRFNAIYKTKDENMYAEGQLELAIAAIRDKVTPQQPAYAEDISVYAQASAEYMVSFLYEPEQFIDFLLALPAEVFPYISRDAVTRNKQAILTELAKQPRSYFRTEKEDRVNLTKVANLLVDGDSIFESPVGQEYSAIVESINDKTGLEEIIGQFDTHTSWIFERYRDYYLFRMLFFPLKQA